jgi:hypothetical protein
MMEFQSALDFLSGSKKPKEESATGFDSALQFLEGLQRPPVAPLTPQQAQSQFAQIPFQPSAQPAPQAPQPAPQGNAVQRAIAPAASFLDVTLGGLAPGIIEPVAYAGSRAFGATPEQATQSSQAAAAPFVDPFGKTLGVSNLPQYKGEASRQLMEFIGTNMGKGAEYIAQQTGYPVADIQNMMGTLVAGGGTVAGRALTGRGVSPAVTQMQDQYAASLKQRQPRIEPTMTPEGAVTPETVAAVTPEAPVAPVAAAAMPEVPMATPAGEMVVSKAPGIEVSYIKPVPDVPTNTPFITSPLQERIAPDSRTTPRPTIDNPFVEPMYAKTGTLPIEEQLYRAKTIEELGIPTIRQGTITGDAFKTADEYVTAKTSGPNRDLFNQQIATEQQALRDYARGIVEKTGGSVGLDENALYNRGQSIAQPFDAFKTLLTEQMRGAYQAAGEVAQGAPAVMPETFQKFLNTNSNFVVDDSFKTLRNGIKSHLTEQGLVNKDGSVKAMTVDQSELLRQYINSNWKPERSRIIHKLTDSIDNDVTKVAGTDIYETARGIRTKMANLLEDPVGVSKIMDYDPKTPINRTTPFPKIPDAIEKMTPDQQAHLVKVLQDMPPELQPQAQKAIAEIKSQFANRIAEVGGKIGTESWNATAVSKYLRDNNRSLRILTGDPQMARSLTVLNDGGHFLKMADKYPGAAIQFRNMYDNPLISGTAQAIGGALGAGAGYVAAGGTSGAAILSPYFAGVMKNYTAGKMQQRSAARAARKGQESLRPISEVLTSLQKKR